MIDQDTTILSRDAIREKITHLVSEATNLPQHKIVSDLPLASYGLDSVNAISLTGELECWLDVDLEPTLAWDYPTIDGISDYLCSLPSIKLQADEPLVDLAVQS